MRAQTDMAGSARIAQSRLPGELPNCSQTIVWSLGNTVPHPDQMRHRAVIWFNGTGSHESGCGYGGTPTSQKAGSSFLGGLMFILRFWNNRACPLGLIGHTEACSRLPKLQWEHFSITQSAPGFRARRAQMWTQLTAI